MGVLVMNTLMPSPPMQQATQTLQQVFGYPSFRSQQALIIQSVLDKQNTLAIMPTGAGKSLCYQIPALLFDGLTVVISPLISLMEDQVRQLRALDIEAALLNSTLSSSEYAETCRNIENQTTKLLFLAPETALQSGSLDLLSRTKVACLAIDEAHCISEWGHEFRPEYRQLGQLIDVLNTQEQSAISKDSIALVALTATATPRVRQDIKRQLGISDEHEFLSSFDRPNLFLNVVEKSTPFAQCKQIIDQHSGQAGIIYCQAKKTVNEVAQRLQDEGIKALPYHAGLTSQKRSANQDKFIKDDVQIIVATIAFGMGINKPDVRYVIHYDLPKNIESYYQQIGRAGRDGLDAHCTLLFGYGDTRKVRYFIDQMINEDEKRLANLHLNQMLAFAEAEDCRRVPLLKYFGEQTETGECKQCDNCLNPDKQKDDLTVVSQKFLSCVLRTGQRFGANHVIDVLRGSNAEKILQNQHNLLSTYNIGGEFTKKQWASLSRRLLQKGYLRQEEQFGGLKLTQLGVELLKGKVEFWGTIQADNSTASISNQKSSKGDSNAGLNLAPDEQLLKALKTLRKTLSDEANLPPYAVFSDRSLIEMAHFLPHSQASFLQIHGVGQAKLEKYADAFLDVIQAHCHEHNLSEVQNEAVASVAKKTASSSALSSKTKEIAKRFNQGESIEQLANCNKVKPQTILTHLEKFIKANNQIDNPEQFLSTLDISKSLLDTVVRSFKVNGTERLKPTFDELDGRLDYLGLTLIRLYYMCNVSFLSKDTV